MYCPCDLTDFIRNVWENCPALVDCMEWDQIKTGEFLGDPNQPWGVIEEFQASRISCNSSGDLYQVPLIMTFHCFKDKKTATKLAKLVYNKFHRKHVNQATECGKICEWDMVWPVLNPVNYNYVLRIQSTIKLSVSL